jgi:hypothetical protein
VNYEDIKEQVIEYIKRPVSLETGLNDLDYELKLRQDLEYKNKIWFYSSDYSDIL